MNTNELAQWVLSDFWRFTGAVILSSIAGNAVIGISETFRATPEERMHKRRLKHDAEQAEKRREHEKEMSGV